MEMYVKNQRFEIQENGHIAFADFHLDGKNLTISHVEAPIPLRGTGAAGRLMEQICERATAEGWQIHPTCGYARAWINKHGAYKSLVI